ncbi:molybdate ABC transporter permease subunit [Paenibacillus sp. TRM 82003]|nr:molybdate ABC transporter permease subunit [Paenibacillus sp. TRM 82003]
MRGPWTSFWDPVLLSLQTAGAASAAVFLLGVLAAWGMRRATFRGKTLLETAFLLPLVLPPTVVGFVLLVLLGRRSWIGQAYEALFRQPIVFTWVAAVIAAVVVAFPLVYQTAKVGFDAIDRDLEDAGRSFGASEWQVARWITLPLASRSLVAAFVLGFARALGEFGATLMLAGNIPGRTQTVPTAIYLATEAGRTGLAWLWCGVVVAISFGLLAIASRYR